MDKNVLSEYADMKEEIKDLRRRIEADRKALDKLHRMIVTDSVTCGKKGKKPLCTVKVQGVPVSAIERREAALEKRLELLQELEASLVEKQVQVEKYISLMEKSELRIMFRFYFIDDLSYPKVAMEMNKLFPKRKKRYTEDSVRKRIQRFLENFENVPQCPDKTC